MSVRPGCLHPAGLASLWHQTQRRDRSAGGRVVRAGTPTHGWDCSAPAMRFHVHQHPHAWQHPRAYPAPLRTIPVHNITDHHPSPCIPVPQQTGVAMAGLPQKCCFQSCATERGVYATAAGPTSPSAPNTSRYGHKASPAVP